MITADILPPCDDQSAGQLSQPATGRSTRRHTSASRGLLAALPVLVGAHAALAAPDTAAPESASGEATADAAAIKNSALTTSAFGPVTRASRHNAEMPESGVRRRSTRATMPVALERALGVNTTFESRMDLGDNAESSLDPFARTSHRNVALQEGVTRRRSTRATMPLAFERVPGSVSSTVETNPVRPIVRTVALAKAAPLMPVPSLALPPMPVNSGKAILPRSSFADSRLETAALRVLRPQSTQWLQFTGARTLESAHAAAPFTAPLPVNELSADATRGMRKVIAVSALKVPPTNKPLPAYMQARAISADKAGTIISKRTAQNPNAEPLRQPGRPVTNSDRLPNQLEVSAGTFVVLLTTTDLNTVAIADPNVADVAVVNSRSVLVNGKAPGVTSLVIVDQNRIRQYQVRVSPAQGTRATDVAAAIGLPSVSVRPLRDALVLEGEVDSPEEARRAVEIAGVFSSKVLNQLTVRGAPSSDAALAAQIQNAINLPNVSVRTIGDTVVVDGTVENAAQRQRAQNVAEALGKKVLNLIELPTLTLDQVRESIGALPNDTTAIDAVGIRVRQVGDQIIIEGIAPNQNAIDQAITTATRSGFQVVNRVQVAPAVPAELALLNSITSAINISGVRVSGTAKRLVLQGQVSDTNQAVLAEQIARGYASEVDNLLVTPNPINVNVDVKLIEINKNDLRNLGVTFTNFIDGAANPVGFVLSEPTTSGTPGLVVDNRGPIRTRSPLQASIRAVLDNGRARLLNNPNTTVLSGRTATFQVGGQVPIPGSTTVTNSGSTTQIIFKDFGVLIDIVPSARLDGVVTMRVRTEVSQPDFTLGVTPPGGGSPIPGFQRRSAVTEVTVQPGGTIALAGLIQNNSRQLVRRVPLLSQIPILGALFTSKRFQNDETELAIFVTPRVLPNPLKPGEVAPAAPIPVGNTTNVGTTTGNPGIASFNTGALFAPASGGGAGQ
jgi:pilus assembly protein CpaC